MPLSETDVKKYLANHPFNAFSLVCKHNSDLQILDDQDAKTYLQKHDHLAEMKIISAIITSTTFGCVSRRILPGKGSSLKALGVAGFALGGVYLGTRIASYFAGDAKEIMANTITKYSGWAHDPKVIKFFQNK